jgi:hypothetical protein
MSQSDQPSSKEKFLSGIRPDGTVEGYAVETHYMVCKGAMEDDGFLRVIVDGPGYDIETRVLDETLKACGYARLADEPGADLDAGVVKQTLTTELPPFPWQPIETAPKGGKWVLLWWPAVTDAPFVGYCVLGEWRAATSGDKWSRSPGPTHWMPLPAPPVATPGENSGE